MEDIRSNLPEISPNPLSSLICLCTNEILIRNHLYILSMSIDQSEQSQIVIKVDEEESADQWKSSFNTPDIENMTEKTGNFKSFDVFVNMLENAINQKSSSVSIDLFTSDDLKLIRQKEENAKNIRSIKFSNKRYLILIYKTEFDCIYYPLSLRYCGKPNPVLLIKQIRQLRTENQLLKSRFESINKHSNVLDEKDKDKELKFLREMIRQSEIALFKEENHWKRSRTKNDDRYKLLLNQIESLKISERQLKLKVKSLANDICLVKQNSSPSKSHQRSSSTVRSISTVQHRYRSGSVTKYIPSSTDCHTRFNPTTYVRERNLKLREIQLQKKKDTRQRLNSARCLSDSNTSDVSFKSDENAQHLTSSKKNSRRKRTNNLPRRKSKDSIDSDIERISSAVVLRKGLSNNSTLLFYPERCPADQENNEYFTSIDSMGEIDQRLKSLEKFIKQNFPH